MYCEKIQFKLRWKKIKNEYGFTNFIEFQSLNSEEKSAIDIFMASNILDNIQKLNNSTYWLSIRNFGIINLWKVDIHDNYVQFIEKFDGGECDQLDWYAKENKIYLNYVESPCEAGAHLKAFIYNEYGGKEFEMEFFAPGSGFTFRNSIDNYLVNLEFTDGCNREINAEINLETKVTLKGIRIIKDEIKDGNYPSKKQEIFIPSKIQKKFLCQSVYGGGYIVDPVFDDGPTFKNGVISAISPSGEKLILNIDSPLTAKFE